MSETVSMFHSLHGVAVISEMVSVFQSLYAGAVITEMVSVFQRLYGGNNGEDQLHSSLSVAVDW